MEPGHGDSSLVLFCRCPGSPGAVLSDQSHSGAWRCLSCSPARAGLCIQHFLQGSLWEERGCLSSVSAHVTAFVTATVRAGTRVKYNPQTQYLSRVC